MSIFQIFNPELHVSWTPAQKFLLRVFLIFFVIFTVPLDWKYFYDISHLEWEGFNYGVIFEITRYFPRLLSDEPLLLDVILVLALAAGLSVVWSKLEKSEPHWQQLYSILRILVRYRLAAVLFAYGFIKVFPIQSPFPSITLLNTSYGDLSAWKIFSLSLGIVPDYQAFLGGFEILAALLLLNRKTASIGAFIALLFLGNVAMSNLAYEGGEFVFSGVLTLFALFTFLHDWPKFYSLLFLRRKTVPEVYTDPISPFKGLALKYAFILVFVGIYGVLVYIGYEENLTKYPASKGIEGLAGVYDVSEFIVDGDTLPYGQPQNARRWTQVVFEKWATLAIETAEPVQVDFTNTEYIAVSDQKRLYEAQGIQGWKFFGYQYTESDKSLTLINRNPDHAGESFKLFLDKIGNGELKISGTDQSGAYFQATLLRNNKKYLLLEAKTVGRRGKLIL